MGQFRATINYCELKEIHLQDCRFTWSNGQHNPTLERIDKVFCNPQWDQMFSDCFLWSVSSSISDHSPLLISKMEQVSAPRRFNFENYWTLLTGYNEVVQEAWS